MTDDALDRLEAEVAAEGTGWFITKRLVLAACLWRGWDERLQAGG